MEKFRAPLYISLLFNQVTKIHYYFISSQRLYTTWSSVCLTPRWIALYMWWYTDSLPGDCIWGLSISNNSNFFLSGIISLIGALCCFLFFIHTFINYGNYRCFRLLAVTSYSYIYSVLTLKLAVFDLTHLWNSIWRVALLILRNWNLQYSWVNQ